MRELTAPRVGTGVSAGQPALAKVGIFVSTSVGACGSRDRRSMACVGGEHADRQQFLAAPAELVQGRDHQFVHAQTATPHRLPLCLAQTGALACKLSDEAILPRPQPEHKLKDEAAIARPQPAAGLCKLKGRGRHRATSARQLAYAN